MSGSSAGRLGGEQIEASAIETTLSHSLSRIDMVLRTSSVRGSLLLHAAEVLFDTR